MIGQEHLLKIIDKNIENGFPKFSIIQGKSGYGRKTLCRYIADKLHIGYVICNTKTDEVKDIIQKAYLNEFPVMYIFPDADTMHTNAKNALLKITEEPPKNSYFVMTIQNTQQLLDTLLSRGALYTLEEYTSTDITQFIHNTNTSLSDRDMNILLNICHGPSDVYKLLEYGVYDFYDYCEQVLDNIGLVPGYNAFKITTKLNAKENAWDLDLFFDTISLVSLQRYYKIKDDSFRKVIDICSKFKFDWHEYNYNKQLLLDDWVLKMREVLY